METFSYKAVDASGKDVKGAVEADEADPCHSHRKTDQKPGPQLLLPLQAEVGEQGGEKRGDGDDDTHIGGQRVGQGDILQ